MEVAIVEYIRLRLSRKYFCRKERGRIDLWVNQICFARGGLAAWKVRKEGIARLREVRGGLASKQVRRATLVARSAIGGADEFYSRLAGGRAGSSTAGQGQG